MKLIKFEDLVISPKTQIMDIAAFLGKTLTSEEVDRLATHILFENMSKNPMTNMEDRKFYKKEIFPFLRCGKVGQWKDFLTVEQSEEIDNLLKQMPNIPY